MSYDIPERATLKIAKAKATTVNGIATVLLKVPGSPITVSRSISGGEGWFETSHPDDFAAIFVTDEDNILGYGIGFVVGTYVDTALPIENQGWYLPRPTQLLNVEAMTSFGRLNGGFYLKIVATKGDLSLDTFRCNIIWGLPQ